jgi:hypothetical protein
VKENYQEHRPLNKQVITEKKDVLTSVGRVIGWQFAKGMRHY